MFFLAFTYALAWWWIICRAYDKWATFCDEGHAAGVKNPTMVYIKTIPARIEKFVDEVNEMFWFGG